MSYPKGKWEIRNRDEVGLYPQYIIGDKIGNIAYVYGITNAYLIVAAPDMHEALTDFPNPLIRGEFTLEQAQKLLKAWRDKYWYKVLAKAEGDGK